MKRIDVRVTKDHVGAYGFKKTGETMQLLEAEAHAIIDGGFGEQYDPKVERPAPAASVAAAQPTATVPQVPTGKPTTP